MNKVLFGDVLYIKGRIGWQALKKDEYLTDGDYYLVTGVDITDEHRIDFSKCYYVDKDRYELDDKIQLKNGDIIVTKDGTIGKIALIENLDKPATLNSHLFLIRNLRPDIIDTHYLFYIFQSEHFKKYATNNTSGSNIPAFTQKNISEFEIDLPDIEVQRKVADILKQIDDKIINNNAINTELAAMAKTIYDYWFLQFEFPDKNGKPYKSSGGKMVWNEELKRDIPYGWEAKQIKEILSKIPKTKKYKTNEYSPSGKFPIIDQSDKYICGFTNESDNLLNLKDCVVFGDHTKHIKYVNFQFARGADGTQILNSSDNRLSNYLLYLQIKDLNLVSQGYSRYFKFLKEKYILIPTMFVEEKFSNAVNSALQKTSANIVENQELASLRDFLLPLLMNGQVTFKEDN